MSLATLSANWFESSLVARAGFGSFLAAGTLLAPLVLSEAVVFCFLSLEGSCWKPWAASCAVGVARVVAIVAFAVFFFYSK